MSAPVFPSFQSGCRVGSQTTTNTSHHQHRRNTASPVRSVVLPSRQTPTCMCKAYPMGTPVRKGDHAMAHNALTPLLLIAAAHPLWKPWLTTSVLSFEHLCFQLALSVAVRKKDGSKITQSVEIRGLQLHHARCQVLRPRSTAMRCMLQVPKVGVCS
jgi:hypothetical protein